LAQGLLQAMAQRLVNVDGPQGLYGIAYSSEPRVSLAVYGGDGRAAARIDAPQLPLPATWLRSPEKLEAGSDAERLLVLPLQPEGMLVVRHHARFSVWKNLQSTLRDTGAYLWFLVLMVSIPGSAFGIGLTLWLARRLRRMAAVSDAWAKGDFRPRMDDRRLIGPLFWLHGDESRAQIEGELAKVAEGGNGCFTAESRPHSDWLGEGWFRDLGICLEAAKKHGLLSGVGAHDLRVVEECEKNIAAGKTSGK
jgi:hypothetical protein